MHLNLNVTYGEEDRLGENLSDIGYPVLALMWKNSHSQGNAVMLFFKNSQ